jgi:hypothetical protein
VTLTKEQKIHDLAVAFATAEYSNGLKRQEVDTSEAAQNGSLIFLSLYKGALVDFERDQRNSPDD